LIRPPAESRASGRKFAAMDACSDLFCDFRIYYFPMGEALFRTGLPVSGFLYSPFVAILLAVFPPIGPDASLVVWGTLQVVFVAPFAARRDDRMVFFAAGVDFLTYPTRSVRIESPGFSRDFVRSKER
jgi:hypothetical protein